MQEIEIESNFQGNIVLDSDSFDGEYDNLFKGIRKAIKDRGLLGGMGQLTGLSTNKGVERRQIKREAKVVRKADRNERKNILADAKANVKNSEAEAQVGQANMLASISQATPEGPKKSNKTVLWAGIGGGVLLLIGVVIFIVLKKKGA
ncbi:MAG TPA: hypothetical protein VF691_04180 [Cytophagaceae bacterium]|jgi:hypothetical protein